MARNKKPRRRKTPPHKNGAVVRGSLLLERLLSAGIGWTKEDRDWLTLTLMVPIHALIASKGAEPREQWATAKSELVLAWVLVSDEALKKRIATANYAFQVAYNCWLKNGARHVLYPQLWRCRDTMLEARNWILENLQPMDAKAIGNELEMKKGFFDAAEEKLDALLPFKKDEESK